MFDADFSFFSPYQSITLDYLMTQLDMQWAEISQSQADSLNKISHLTALIDLVYPDSLLRQVYGYLSDLGCRQQALISQLTGPLKESQCPVSFSATKDQPATISSLLSCSNYEQLIDQCEFMLARGDIVTKSSAIALIDHLNELESSVSSAVVGKIEQISEEIKESKYSAYYGEPLKRQVAYELGKG